MPDVPAGFCINLQMPDSAVSQLWTSVGLKLSNPKSKEHRESDEFEG